MGIHGHEDLYGRFDSRSTACARPTLVGYQRVVGLAREPFRTAETPTHYLLDCPSYGIHRAIHFRTLGREGRKLSILLNSKAALRPLFAYVNATERFRRIFGLLPQIENDDDD